MLPFDGSLGALDAKARRELRQDMRDIHDETGLTTSFVTHDQAEAMALADLVVVMSMGRDLPPGRPSFITRVLGFDSRRFRMAQARRAGSPQIAQAPGALLLGSGC